MVHSSELKEYSCIPSFQQMQKTGLGFFDLSNGEARLWEINLDNLHLCL